MAGKPQRRHAAAGVPSGARQTRATRGRLSSLELLPDAAQDDAAWALAELDKRERTAAAILAELNVRLAAKGIKPISKSAFNRKSIKAVVRDQRATRGRLSSVDLLPEEAQDDVVWAVGELNQRGRTAADILDGLNQRLALKGIEPISKSAFNRKSVKLAAMSHRLNEARHIFAGIAPQLTPERIDENTLVLGEFIKLLIFELVQDDGSAIGTKGAMELARAHLAVIQSQKVSADRRSRLEAEFIGKAAKAIDQVGKRKGLSEEVLQDLRRDLFGVAAPRAEERA